ncbi:hypothetical protein [Nocardioides sp. NPDC047086]|uniref:hypothetical protein n=1 Tax=Nocardioides sp. NPDC047086 TaxID=3154810 RepID=UPI0033D07C7A
MNILATFIAGALLGLASYAWWRWSVPHNRQLMEMTERTLSFGRRQPREVSADAPLSGLEWLNRILWTAITGLTAIAVLINAVGRSFAYLLR